MNNVTAIATHNTIDSLFMTEMVQVLSLQSLLFYGSTTTMKIFKHK